MEHPRGIADILVDDLRKVQLDVEELLSEIFICDCSQSFAPLDDVRCPFNGISRPYVLHHVKDDIVDVPQALFWLLHAIEV